MLVDINNPAPSTSSDLKRLPDTPCDIPIFDTSSDSKEILDIPYVFVASQDKSTQTYVEREHKYVEIKPTTFSKNTQTIFEKEKKKNSVGITCDIIVPSMVHEMKKLHISQEKLNETVESISSGLLDSSVSYACSSDKKSSTSERMNLQLATLRDSIYEKYTKLVIEDDPLTFLGIPMDCMFVVDLIHDETGVSIKDIHLTLKKIRTNLSFTVLAYEFSLSESQVSRNFRKTVHVIAKCLKQLIVWPSRKDILLNLPAQFRYRYYNVQSIIDCFEIEIEKPSNALNQALTWSKYKKCNTAKYLISITPDGIINFLSEGVCGRCSDMALVENCGYLDKLPSNISVLADRGFKQLDTLLHKKKCTLIRPPSVIENKRSSKDDVKLTKQIASIRIHVERVINRIRHFQFLNIHSRIDKNLVNYLDSAVLIAAALVNLQGEIIKQN